MLAPAARFLPRFASKTAFFRSVSSLSSNPRIKVFPADASRASFLLSYLEDEPPNQRIAIGFSTTDPPTPRSFIENQTFTKILYEVLSEHAHEDKDLLAQAQAFAGPGGANLGSGGAFFSQKNKKRSSSKVGGGGGAGGSGAGGGGHGGYVHLSDSRNPPDFGRIAWPEDILGSVEVDRSGNIIGQLEPSGTYRIITNEGILGLSPFLTEKLVERLRAEDKKDKP
ncbi:hypothetical protein ColTof4_00486 [Colletotrichum tofieldiae]|uniref:Uncharacterized protein n=1 Tax=Colletotrichum tofieldiae TaxID=708197 RepID=A0A166X336_9PEZI|nr:hypothetical protein CT0861_08878 [Colletotrichum tofieldiae]GKT68063.1 hypothetical protein ColTof4_00486 [Colletotrichum tofieldiae]GKT90948.1 hypothetical protein Ct61P_08798 [Colletotrichum tofieldiae]